MDFIAENYIWIAIITVIVIMTIIGYIADKTEFGNKGLDGKEKVKKEKLPKEKKPKKEKVKKDKKVKEEVVEEIKEETAVEENNLDNMSFEEENIDVNPSEDSFGFEMPSELQAEETNDIEEMIEEPNHEEVELAEEEVIEPVEEIVEPVVETITEEPENKEFLEDFKIEEPTFSEFEQPESNDLPSVEDLNEELSSEDDDDVWKF